jgi:hypothetical protein
VHHLHRTYHRLKNSVGRTQWNSYVMWVLWNLVSVRLKIVSVSVQDRCKVCMKHTIGSKIVVDAPNGTHLTELLDDVGHVESHFSLFVGSVSVGAR